MAEEQICLPVTNQPRRRVYRCGHCRQEGHNRSTCPGLEDQRRLDRERRIQARQEAYRAEKAKTELKNIQFHNPTQHIMMIFWSNNLEVRTEDSEYRFLATMPVGSDTILRFNKRHKFIAVPVEEFETPPTEWNELIQTPIRQTIFHDQHVKDVLEFSEQTNEQPLVIINDIKDYKPPKNELDRWKETAFKSLFLLTELKRMGASNNENLAPMIDMIEDIILPPHTELDKELAGVPSVFTNVT
jgi:hypothetical protein